MTGIPDNPKIYHITHVNNLARIAEAGVLWSDAKRVELGLDCQVVGMSTIKRRRLVELEVNCHPGTKVGEYVPFYFCPRSIMLYILHMANHPELTYTGGQRPIVHMEADLRKTVAWAKAHQRRWTFSDCNAGARYANFWANLGDLDKIDWAAMEAADFRDIKVKEGKQAEFLVHESFPWELVERIGVMDRAIAAQVNNTLREMIHKPVADVQRTWYY